MHFILKILKFDILRVPHTNSDYEKLNLEFFLRKFHPRTYLMTLLVTMLGSKNQKKHPKGTPYANFD
jgi:hypothetical protein